MKSYKHKFEKDVLDMDLHEELVADPMIGPLGASKETTFEHAPLRVLRVPGGWIYYNAYITEGGVFVSNDV